MKILFLSVFICQILINCTNRKNPEISNSRDKTDSTNIVFYNSPILDCQCKITKKDSVDNVNIFYSSFRGRYIKILTSKNFKTGKVLQVGNAYDVKIKSLKDLGFILHGLRGVTFENIFFEMKEGDINYDLYELQNFKH